MTRANLIREKVKKLFDTNPRVHISVNMSRPKTLIDNKEALIKGVYPNIFRIEELGEKSAHHTISYSDLLTGAVKIKELEE